MENDNGSERLSRIEAPLEAIALAMADGFENLIELNKVTQATLRLLDNRLTILEGQMTEVIGRLRIIGEQLATHTHEEETGA